MKLDAVTSEDNVITVDFGKKVNSSALTIANYSLSGSALSANKAKIAYAKTAAGAVDQTKVVITLKDEKTVATSDNNAVLAIAANAITALDGSKESSN